ncbi:MAG: M20/M25/M40 family metallo-hydrolase [Planctomycetaceae bacterium]
MNTAANAAPSVDETAAVALVTEMMAIPGQSCEEGAVAAYIRRRLLEAGIPESAIVDDAANRRSPVGGEVGNTIVKLPGSMRGPRRLLMAHVDTVPLCVGARPVCRGNYIHSKDKQTALGGDDRAGAAVVLNAILEIERRNLPHPPLTLFWPVQEEIGLYGARFVSKSKLGNPKLCFNWDGGEPDMVVTAATGDYAITIEIEGIASHAGGHPEQGVSAIAVASKAIADLHDNGWHGLVLKGRNAGSSNVGVISGGDATNVVTPHLSLRAEARSHNPRFRKRIVEEFRKAFQRAAKSVKNDAGKTGTIRFDADLKYESFRMKETEPCVQHALQAIELVGLKGQTRTANGGLDANWLTVHGYATATVGCGQDAIHTVNERLHVPSFLNACRVGLTLATGATSGSR